MNMLDEVACIVVHHRSYGTVGLTIRSLLEEGITPDNIVVIDNSEEPDRRPDLERLVCGVPIVHCANRGFGAAVNLGLARLRSNDQPPRYVLVATHEARPAPHAVDALGSHLDARPRAGAAGPTLIVGDTANGRVWSCGGSVSRHLHDFCHVGSGRALDDVVVELPAQRLWLDGAFVLYRWEALVGVTFDERYFLYMEEADLHFRLRRRGWTCEWVPGAVVWQSTGLTPSYYYCRNIRLFFRLNESGLRRWVSPPLLAGRHVYRQLRNRQPRSAWDGLRGSVARLDSRS